MDYGKLPPYNEFLKYIQNNIDPETDTPYLSKGEKYPYTLRGSDATVAKRVKIPTQGNFDARKMYSIISKLIDAWNSGDDEAGDLASSFMFTLGYYW